MKCADPTLCYTRPDGRKTYRSFSMASRFHLLVHQTVFSCGKCLICRKKRAYELASRCVLHSSMYKQSCFITLTYDEKEESYHNVFNYPDIQRFKKILRNYHNEVEYSHIRSKKLKRRRVDKRFYKPFEIFNVHEYGRNKKKHWHLIVFGLDFQDKEVHSIKNNITIYKSKQLRQLWPHGYNTIGDVTEASAMYQAQYMEKDFKHGNNNSNLKSHSKHSGIGKPYFMSHFDQILSLGYIPFGGRKLPIPRYFEKIAQRHYAYFFDRSLFVARGNAKSAPCRPFGPKDSPIRRMADLYRTYLSRKEEFKLDLEQQWKEVLETYLTTSESPDFIKSASNQLYDLRNKNTLERF